MSFLVMADNLVDISAKRDGALYNVALAGSDLIIKDLGEEFAMSHTGLSVSVGTGEAILHGRHITAEETNEITLPANESGYLVLRIDLTRPIGTEAYLYATPTLDNEEINWNGTKYDMVLAEFTTSNIDITSFTDKRYIASDTSEVFKKLLPIINLLPSSLGTTTSNGVTCTKNADGSYTLNGTASGGNAIFWLIGNNNSVTIGKPFRYFGNNNSSSATYYASIHNVNTDTWNTDFSGDIIPSGTYNYLRLIVLNGISVNNVVFKPMITTNLNATYDDFVSYDNSIALNNNGWNMDLLWTNASPTSTFNPQTISLNLSSYKMVLMQFRRINTTDGAIKTEIVRVGVGGIALTIYGGKIVDRVYVTSTNGVQINNGEIVNTYGTVTTNNDYLVPTVIYGIK